MRLLSDPFSRSSAPGWIARSAGAQAVPTDDAAPAAGVPSGIIQLAGSPNKLGDKYLAGQAGGRYGIGGTERDKAKGGRPASPSKSKNVGGNAQSQKPVEKRQQQRSWEQGGRSGHPVPSGTASSSPCGHL